MYPRVEQGERNMDDEKAGLRQKDKRTERSELIIVRVFCTAAAKHGFHVPPPPLKIEIEVVSEKVKNKEGVRESEFINLPSSSEKVLNRGKGHEIEIRFGE